MATLDVYDPEGFVKWHHFAFRADAGRVTALQSALEAWVSWRDRGPLEAFWVDGQNAWNEKLFTAAVELDPTWFEPLLAHAANLDIDPVIVRERIDALGTRMPRLLHRDVLAFPDRVARLARLCEQDAEQVIIEHELYSLRRTFDLEPLEDGETPIEQRRGQVAALSSRELFEDAIDLAIGDPWAENTGFGRMYGVLFEELPFVDGRSLVAPSWPVHHENLEAHEPFVYGFDGFPISIIDTTSDSDAIAAFEPSIDDLRAFATDRVIAQLNEEGIDVYYDDHLADDLLDDDVDEITAARRKTESIASDRIRFSLAQVTHEWRTTKARFVAALRDVSENRCVLLQWNAKHPAL